MLLTFMTLQRQKNNTGTNLGTWLVYSDSTNRLLSFLLEAKRFDVETFLSRKKEFVENFVASKPTEFYSKRI